MNPIGGNRVFIYCMDIVEEIRNDSEKGARSLEAEYRAGLLTLARRLCRNESDAAELVNRTFAEVIANIDSYAELSAECIKKNESRYASGMPTIPQSW